MAKRPWISSTRTRGRCFRRYRWRVIAGTAHVLSLPCTRRSRTRSARSTNGCSRWRHRSWRPPTIAHRRTVPLTNPRASGRDGIARASSRGHRSGVFADAATAPPGRQAARGPIRADDAGLPKRFIAPSEREIDRVCGIKERHAHRRALARQRVARTSSTRLIANQNAALDELLNVAQRGISRALRERGPLRRCQVPLESLEQRVDHQALTLVQCHVAQLLPVARLLDNA